MKAKLAPLGIGSVPFSDINFTFDLIEENYKEIPYWPQFPRVSNYENMYIQFSEGLPGVCVNIENGSIFVDTSKDIMKEIEKFFESVIEDNLDYFKISETYAKGLYEFKNRFRTYSTAKGHITGPISFGLTVTDENKKSIIYNNEFKEIIPTFIAKKAKWQEKFLEKENIIIFFDEPYMVSYGSAFFNLSEDDVIEALNICFNEINGITGIHCCGNTDWSLIFKTEVKIINFDAYGYIDNFLLYKSQIKEFLEKGNYLAWGFIPTDDEAINKITIEELIKRFDDTLNELVKFGIDKELILNTSFLTPSCGTGTMKPENAQKVLKLNRLFSERLKEKYKIF